MASRTDAEHKAQAPHSVCCYVVTVSDTRTTDTDASGRLIADLLAAAGHVVAGRAIVKDNPDLVRDTIIRQLATPGLQAIITTGGTGISSRDSTFEAISAMLQKRLDGFGELFRMLSYEQIGPAAIMSRACAGLASGRIIISLPGSEAAVRLGMDKLIVPELSHMVQQAER
jgi:molybdenum cofactor biosynthesis protein B